MNDASSVPLLSKTRYAAGLQCAGRLYRMCFQPELATPPDAAQQARFDAGTRVGELARNLRPGGVLIDEPFFRHDDAVARTRALLANGATSAICEAGFTEAGVRIRADILSTSRDGRELIEVKSSTSVKDEHLDDAAIQLATIEAAGVSVDRVCIGHINNACVYQGDEYVPGKLLTVEDITAKARDVAAGVPARIATMREMLAANDAPEPDLGSHCHKPYDCEFYDYCRQGEPEWSIEELPGLNDERRRDLRVGEIRSIRDIPVTFRLSAAQQRVRDTVQSGRPYVSSALLHDLARITSPAHFIDFETVAPALPIFAGTRPYQAQPFQWSDHVLHTDGSLDHYEFLADGTADPRRAFAETLLDGLAGAATIAVYSSFARARLHELQVAFPDLAAPLQAVLDRSWVDLLKVVRDHYYHPEFRGSYSNQIRPPRSRGGLRIQRPRHPGRGGRLSRVHGDRQPSDGPGASRRNPLQSPRLLRARHRGHGPDP